MTEIREQRGVFGEAVDAYDSARPGYPESLVDDVLGYAGLNGSPVLEVGAGTGKASVAFAERGITLTCVEPDARMAAALKGRCEPYPRTTVVVSGFEQWSAPEERFGLLVSAQAWHWIDPASRWTLAFDALRPGGAIALFWNQFSVPDTVLLSALTDVHARHGVEALASATLGSNEPSEPPSLSAWPLSDLQSDDRFRDIQTRTYRTRYSFTSTRYIDLLASISAYRMLSETQRGALFAEVARVVDGHERSFEIETSTHLYLARTRR